ncbi:S-adenosyl-L-methionine-dependent methyltransferase [Paraphysoderma sedebokerense]|nr:S-adenosyl-L-methionine-dependent methyltransferase [Paraphysoderma sedebokerense]
MRQFRLAIVVVIVALATNNLLNHPHVQRGVVQSLHNPPTETVYKIIDRAESNTGFISVFEESTRKIRILRAGHSVIGGMFTNTNDSVYAGFYFHEAVRLIKRPSRLHLAPGTDEKGLNIGLGIGVAASSLIQHGVDMDIVEIDPQVVNFARDYFGLDTVKGHVFVQDGRDFVETSQLGVYDYVIHDVFTGGSLPKSLFSFEVLLRIRQILKRDGVLSVNFVGEGGSRAFDAVTKTLAYVFPYVTCYREETGGKEEHLHNYVFFASSHPIQFRPATESDILGSDWRWFAFSNLQKWEVNLSSILSSPSTIRAPSVQSLSDEEYNVLAQNNFELVKPKGREKKLKDWTEGFVIVDDDNPLDDALYPVAKDHWRIMREVFADKVWYNF